MADLRIELVGLPALIAKLGRGVANQTLERAMTKATARIQADLQKYPSPPSGSTYVRTGDLGRSWTSRTIVGSGGVIGQIGNAVRSRRGGQQYAPYVQRDPSEPTPHQAGHMSHWTNKDVASLEKNRSAIEHDFAREIDNALGK